MEDDGMLHVPSFKMPFSNLGSPESRDAAVAHHRAEERWHAGSASKTNDTAELRNEVNRQFVLPLLARQRSRWKEHVQKEALEIGGVHTDVFVPRAGVASRNRSRVLVNVHGGGFLTGSRTLAEVESLPIAARGAIKVVSVDYRMAPEHLFPAASADLAAVYEQLLDDYEPRNIGIYGSSAGGILTAQAVPWFLDQQLPLPGALGMFAGTGQLRAGGDAAILARRVYGVGSESSDEAAEPVRPYFAEADMTSALVAPMLWPEVLQRFPPSLLISSTRAHEMSAVIDAHNRLTLAGAQSRLHIWDGLGHCFYLDATLPESQEAERIMVEFFCQRRPKIDPLLTVEN